MKQSEREEKKMWGVNMEEKKSDQRTSSRFS